MNSELIMEADENDPIRKCQHELQRTIDNVERLRPIVKACEEAIQRSGAKAHVSVGTRNQKQPKVEIMMMCKRLDETIPVLRELAKEGLRTDKKETHQDHNIYDVMAMREYNLGPQASLLVMLFGSKKEGDGPTCWMEQVGVKEIPIYEMKCD